MFICFITTWYLTIPIISISIISISIVILFPFIDIVYFLCCCPCWRHKLHIVDRASPAVASRVWNRGRAYRPTSRAASSLSSLKRQLKTALLARSFAGIDNLSLLFSSCDPVLSGFQLYFCAVSLLTLHNLHHARFIIILISDVCLLADLTLLVKFFRNHIAIAN